jgi:endonuclease G
MRKLLTVAFGLIAMLLASDICGRSQEVSKIPLLFESSAVVGSTSMASTSKVLHIRAFESCIQSADSTLPSSLRVRWVSGLELPKLNSSKEKPIHKTGFSLLYNEAHEQATWVAYQLTKSETQGFIERTDNFREDPMVKTGSATSADYQGSGYDRGHLAPAGDMGWSSLAMSESFYYSNMSPQIPAFNRGIWKRLEEKVRLWAMDYDTLYVVTGPVLTLDLPKIGPSQVSVPRYYYKVLLDYSEPEIKGIGFVMPNLGSKLPLQYYAVSIDSVERLTGIDFFPKLADEQENLIEKNVCLGCWSWEGIGAQNGRTGSATGNQAVSGNGTTAVLVAPNSEVLKPGGLVSGRGNTSVSAPRPPSSTAAVQCSGVTQSGARCKRKTTSPNGRCYQH